MLKKMPQFVDLLKLDPEFKDEAGFGVGFEAGSVQFVIRSLGIPGFSRWWKMVPLWTRGTGESRGSLGKEAKRWEMRTDANALSFLSAMFTLSTYHYELWN
ncbi:hypothetical protein Drorol1_Dr00004768 [Drosera rotundifolia]